MDTTELLTMFRAEVDDAVKPYLVSDSLLYAYIDDAQKMFCRMTEGIEDGRSFTLAVTVGTEWYPLDPSILKLRRAYNAATGREIRVVNTEKAQVYGILFAGRTGPLEAFVAGIEKNALRAWPKPNAAVTVPLEVFRLPKTVEAGDNFEVDEQHQQHLLMWAKYRFYGNKDSEVYDKRAAEEQKKEFADYCFFAKKEQERARRITGTVIYGGI